MAVHGVEHDIAEILDGRQAAVETNIEHALARGDFTGRQLDVVPLDRRFDVADRQVVRGQRAAVDPDADGVAAVAPDGHAGYAVQGRQPVDEIALDEIGNLLRRLPVGGDGEPHHRVRIAVVLDDARLVGAVGQTGENAADGVAHVVRRLVDVAADFESDDGPAAPAASTSGRSRTGIENNDAIPETTISALATIARTGRRIDRSDRVIPRPPRHWRFRALAAPSLRLVYRAAHRTPATSPPARHGPPACLRAPLHPARHHVHARLDAGDDLDHPECSPADGDGPALGALLLTMLDDGEYEGRAPSTTRASSGTTSARSASSTTVRCMNMPVGSTRSESDTRARTLKERDCGSTRLLMVSMVPSNVRSG